MKEYETIILNKLLDRYENSAYFKGESNKKRKISINIIKIFPKYGNSNHFYETEKIESAIKLLLEKGFIKKGKNDEFGNRDIVLNQDDLVIQLIYTFLERNNLKKEREIFLNEIDIINSNGFISNFLEEIRSRTIHFTSLSPYLENYSVTELHTIINILEKMENQGQEISFRKFSIYALQDSKKLELYKNKIYHVIHDFYDDSISDEKEAFEMFNIIRNPSVIYVKGCMSFQINNQVIDLNELNNYFVFFSEYINNLKILNIFAKKVITVENWTSFHDLHLQDSLIVYLGGFHGSLVTKFLSILNESVKSNVDFLHFGDIDAGGFYIYLNLIHKTNIKFNTWKMDINTLKKYEQYSKVLTENDRKRLIKLQQELNDPVINYMLENNIKLEQEIVTIEESEKNDS